MKFLLTILFLAGGFISEAQDKMLTKKQVQQDLAWVKKILDENASYVYLNGYDFNPGFENYLKSLDDSVRAEDFGLFLTETIGKMGDRHSSVRGYEPDNSLFLPFHFAPENGKVAVLYFNKNRRFEILNPRYPYLKKIDGTDIDRFLQKILPEEIRAPREAYFTRAVMELRDIQKNYRLLNKTVPEKIELTLSDATFQKDTVLVISPVDRSGKKFKWIEKFAMDYLGVKDEDYNKPEIAEALFSIKDSIAYVRIPVMVSREEAPLLFDRVNAFMKSIRHNSKALIMDVRSNGGGRRDLMYEFARYLVHPDSVYVVNAVKQRGPLPLPEQYKENLNSRYLFPLSELDTREQEAVRKFLKTFQPMYAPDNKKYSEYYFGLLNGKKLAEPSSYYNKPVYILANESSFSAASVFVSVFKGIPNIRIAGVTTDGSSGNSEEFELPHSKLRVKISTMVSFQKDGKILDGYGTEPDIRLERDLDQALWKSDTQLEKLRRMIQNSGQEK